MSCHPCIKMQCSSGTKSSSRRALCLSIRLKWSIIMGVATANRAFADNTSANLCSDPELSVERVPPVIRQMVSTLFVDGHADYERIFMHLLRYAQTDQSGNMATIIIPNQWELHQQDDTWPCCYTTLNTF